MTTISDTDKFLNEIYQATKAEREAAQTVDEDGFPIGVKVSGEERKAAREAALAPKPPTTEDSVRAYQGSSTFIQSLKAALSKYGSLTERQASAAAKFFAPKAPAPATVDLSAIPTFLKAAATNLKWPRLHLVVDGYEMVLKLKTAASAHPWSVELVSREKMWNEKFMADMPKWFGRIEPDGEMVKAGCFTQAMADTLNDFAMDVRAAAVKYASRTGSCSFCGRFLETKESVTVGYGPVCASKYGLPWGDIVEGAVA
jgi:hypothetical protein